MVATRRGVFVTLSTKTNVEQQSDVQDTPSAGRRTRNAAKQAESSQPPVSVETCSKSDAEPPSSSLTPPKKRCTRASRLHSPEQPCTPAGSTHEADVSDLESCCSVASGPDVPLTRSRARGRTPRAAARPAHDDLSDAESCSSSESKPGAGLRRSARSKPALASSVLPATRPCSVVVTESQRVTRSLRRAVHSRLAAQQPAEDSELSDADSWTSGASRRRSRRQLRPIPMLLDEVSEGSLSPSQTGRRTRAASRRKEAPTDAGEPPSCDSEGFESGPAYSLTARRRTRAGSAAPRAGGSDSELTDAPSAVGSPDRAPPCSSRGGSGASRRRAPASSPPASSPPASSPPAQAGPAEACPAAGGAEDQSLNDSRLDSTVIAEDADVTLLEGGVVPAPQEEEDMKSAALTVSQSEAGGPEGGEDGAGQPAASPGGQQGEPAAADQDEDVSDMEAMQETVPPPDPPRPDTETTRQGAPEEEGQQDAARSPLPPLATGPPGEGAAAAGRPEGGEEEQGAGGGADAQQAGDASRVPEAPVEVTLVQAAPVQAVPAPAAVQVPPVQVTSVQQPTVIVDSDSEGPGDVLVRKPKVISLLDSSSDEEEEEEEEEEVSEEEDSERRREEGGEASDRPTAASVDGLFMIDTRPGQDSDPQFYRPDQEEEEEAPSKAAEEEEEEEFVDEEGDDDEDEDAQVLFSSRSSHIKELSSRIDPGVGVKQLGGLYISLDGSKSKPVSSSLQKLKEKKIQEEVMKKSVIGADFEKKEAVPSYSESKQALKLKHRTERQKTTGDGWFDMKAPEVSQELKGDLHLLKIRGSLDPKRFYKKNDRDGFPKYFQVGTVVDSPVDFYHSRIPKKERKRTMVEELLADADFRHQNKKRFQQIMTEKAARGAGKRKQKNKFQKKKNLKTQ